MRSVLQNGLLTAIAVVVLTVVLGAYDGALRDVHFLDGWILFAGCLVQILFSLRRKFPMLPLGRVSAWMRVHVWTGMFLVAAFAFHTGFAWPSGGLETVLWVVFCVLTVSGLFGAWLTHSAPAQLGEAGMDLSFDEIPAEQTALSRRAEEVFAQGAGVMVAEPYRSELLSFFSGRRDARSLLWPSRSRVRMLSGRIDRLEQTTGDEAVAAGNSLRRLLLAKDRLDVRYARELRLRLWLFVHVPATYVMLVLTMAHIAVVYAYTAGVP